jgi:acyl-CoA thioester hydrolase
MSEHQHSIRVRYAETDQMGVAHHAAYVPWFEEARIEWLRARGRSYRQLEIEGVFMPVIEMTVRYRRSLRFDDQASLFTTVVASGPSRLCFATRIMHGEALCAEATVTVAAVDAAGKPRRMPADLQPH